MANPKQKGMSLVQVHVRDDVRAFLGMLGEREGLTRSDIVRRSLYAWFEKEREKNASAFDKALERFREEEKRQKRAKKRAA